MPRIVSNLIFQSREPLDARDNFRTHNEMMSVDERFINVGHISYCEEDKMHYYFVGGTDKWRKLVDMHITQMSADDLADCWWTLFADDLEGSNTEYNDFLYGG